jgi:NDP-sugar pyrophosphorylase family protein
MSKTRLTITISPEIIHQLDKMIDGHTIRNRSHAFEYLVNLQLMDQVHQAVILIGGSPESVTQSTTSVAGQPIITHLINLLQSQGIHQIFILTDQTTEILEETLKNHEHVKIVSQSLGKGTAGALVAAQSLFSPAPLVVMHGDIFTDIKLIDLIRFHHDHGHPATICVKPKLNKQEFGKAIMTGHHITRFLSKPDKSEVSMVNTGVYLISPAILRNLPKKTPLMLETDVFPQLASEDQLAGFLFEGIWYDISKQKV